MHRFLFHAAWMLTTVAAPGSTLTSTATEHVPFWALSAHLSAHGPSDSGVLSGHHPPVPDGAFEGAVGSGTPVWDEEFNDPAGLSRWVCTSTSAYRYRDHNPDDNKLDWLDPKDVSIAGGVAAFTAQPSSHTLENGQQAWTTGLLTTEGSLGNFQVRTGDYVETRVKLPRGRGAWPALWTWKDGGNEIDSFEYHPDNPSLLELSNRVNGGHDYYNNARAVRPGGWVTIGTRYGAHNVDWYVNGAKVYSDGTGVGPHWSAYLILNLSLSAGQYHPTPNAAIPVRFAVDYVRVYR